MLVTPEVLSRVQNQLNLPALTEEESVTYVSGLLQSAKTDGFESLPFTPEAIKTVVGRVKVDSMGEITPRKLAQAFGGVLMSALVSDKSIPIPLDKDTADALYAPSVADHIG